MSSAKRHEHPAAGVLGGFVLHGTVTGAAVGGAYVVVLVLVGSFGENDPGWGFFVDALVFAVPLGVGLGALIGLLTGAAGGVLFAVLAAAGALPERGRRGTAALTLVTAGLTAATARGVLGIFFEAEAIFVWGPAGLAAVAGAGVAHQVLPPGSGPAAR